MRKEIRLSGSGGQGLITAGIILAEACILDGKNVVQTQSYGPEARGGAAKSEVIISDSEIHYPKVTSPDILVALTAQAYSKYINDLKSGADVIVDSMFVKDLAELGEEFTVYNAPIVQTASETLKSPMSANIITLSLLNALHPLVDQKALITAVKNAFPKAVEINMKAIEAGVKLA
jgi:2-oxoglutarate ferredoxin oxidoreductase subunit gamma